MQRTNQTQAVDAIYSDFSDDPDFAELIAMFVESLGAKSQMLRGLHRAGDRDGLRSVAHQLKGAGGGYGFRGMSRLAGDLQAACDADNIGSIKACLDTLLDHLGHVRTTESTCP
jgi:HPt (histidine-containing phosphotransfer) domain-containing protein